MAYTTIDDPSAYFKVQLYTGNGTAIGSGGNAITFNDTDTDMQPDMVWIKSRSTGEKHMLFDAVRGVTKAIKPSGNDAEATNTEFLTAFGSDGFTVGSNDKVNDNTVTFVAWCWKANGAGATNEAGSINTTKTSANTTSGFSISTFTGNASAGATIGHGLGAVPHWFMNKNLADAGNWGVYHHKNTAAPETDHLHLDTNAATADDADFWNDAAPTSTLITLGTHGSINGSGEAMVNFSWTEIQGFSKFGSFVGNGDNDGPFLYCGFKPAWFMSKRTDAAASWNIWNNKSNPHNVADALQYADGTDAEASSASYSIDFLSNGIKMRGYRADTNTNGATHVWMAFAESPFCNSSGVPNNAR